MAGRSGALTELRDAGLAAAGVAAVTAGYVLTGVSNATIVALTYLTVVLAVAALSRRRLAVLTSLVSTACFNFFFLPPVGTFTIANPENWAALFVYLAVSLVAGTLSATARRRTAEALDRRRELARLFDLTRDILLVPEGPDALTHIARFIARRFQFDHVLICVPGPAGWVQHGPGEGQREPEAQLDRALAAGRASLEFDAHTRTYSGHEVRAVAPGLERATVVIRLAERAIGVLVTEGPACEPGTRDAIAGVTAVALERMSLLDDRRQADVVRRTAELRSALFASVSHDLRTPLTAIAAAAANVDSPGLTDVQRAEQIAVVQEEVQRLNRLFQNIVEMARIETASITPEREAVPASELIEAAQRMVEPTLRGHDVRVDDRTADAMPRLDPRLTSTALAHLLENAAQYSPPGAPIEVVASIEQDEVRLAVRDHGEGIADEDRARLFDRFQRGVEGLRRPFGSGLGLAITRGLLVAQDGRVWAENHPDGGAVFTIGVPCGRP